jgi:hypothetical protein
VWLSTACSSVVEAKRYKDIPLASLKKAHVVREPNSTPGCELAAREALERRGLAVTYGVIQEKPKDADFYVELVDRWQWDVAMYLAALDIEFKDSATGEPIARGWFRQGTFHTFPDQGKKTAEVIDAIYNAPSPQK